MVSFSCEGCGDVLTKKKLDSHRNQCRGASFTCIDCMVHFQGTAYRNHTSCMSEAQKYQGALYKEKPAKNQRKNNNNNSNNRNGNQNDNKPQKSTTGHRAPYVEDAPDSQVNLVPTAPTPPTPNEAKQTPGKEAAKVNVFDFMVDEKTPNASKVSLVEPKEQMKMKDHAPSVFETSQAVARVKGDDEESKDYDVAYEEHGYSYGTGPIDQPVYPNKAAAVSMEFMTPAPKKKKDRRGERKQSPPTLSATTSEKKRKRRAEDHDMEDADTPMLEAPSSVLNHPGTPMLNHSGLTGGLDRMLRSPSLDDEGSENPRRRYQDPSSPLKRSRRDEKDDAGLGISIKSRAERLVSSMFAGSSVSGSSVAGNEAEPRKAKKTHKIRNNDQIAPSDGMKTKRKISAQTEGDRPSRRLKKIEYPDSPKNGDRDMVVYRQENHPDEVQRQMAAHFLSLVTKGPESTRGFSVNKVLKRFHKDFTDEFDGDRGRDQGRSRADREQRGEDEKDLWRTLRVKQNERGEIVLFF